MSLGVGWKLVTYTCRNARDSIVATFAGIVIVSKLVQYIKASCSIVSSSWESWILFRVSQLEKALLPIRSTLLGIIIFSNWPQP